jgi:hypothetical protein
VENRRAGHGQESGGTRAAQTDRAPARACPSREGALPRGKGGLEQCSALGGAGRRYGAARVRPAPGWRDVAARLEHGRNYSD